MFPGFSSLCYWWFADKFVVKWFDLLARHWFGLLRVRFAAFLIWMVIRWVVLMVI